MARGRNKWKVYNRKWYRINSNEETNEILRYVYNDEKYAILYFQLYFIVGKVGQYEIVGNSRQKNYWWIFIIYLHIFNILRVEGARYARMWSCVIYIKIQSRDITICKAFFPSLCEKSVIIDFLDCFSPERYHPRLKIF